MKGRNTIQYYGLGGAVFSLQIQLYLVAFSKQLTETNSVKSERSVPHIILMMIIGTKNERGDDIYLSSRASQIKALVVGEK
jgi:hypothetical protein